MRERESMVPEVKADIRSADILKELCFSMYSLLPHPCKHPSIY